MRMKEEQELEQGTGDSVVMLPLVRESEEEPTLLLLPSRISEDRLGKGKRSFSAGPRGSEQSFPLGQHL